MDYSTILEDFNNQGLLRNVLRARDHAPLSFSDLPVIHGSLSMTGSLSASVPFGPVHDASSNASASSMIGFTSSPTFDTAALNTRGFSVLILEPISPTFVASMWGTGFSDQLLLRLFAGSITVDDAKGIPQTFYNDPDGTTYGDFNNIINAVAEAEPTLRVFTLYQPVGPNLDIRKDGKGLGNKDSIGAITGVDETRFHLSDIKGKGKLQLYRVFPSQALLCLNLESFRKNIEGKYPDMVPAVPADHRAPAGGAAVNKDVAHIPEPTLREQVVLSAQAALASASAAAPAGGAAPAASTASSLTPAPQVSTFIDSNKCGTNILHLPSESAPDDGDKRSVRVGWRSLDGVFRYLGQIAGSPSRATWSENKQTHTLFSVRSGKGGRVAVSYRGNDWMLPDEYGPNAEPTSHGLQVLSLLTRLLNKDKIAGDIPITQRLEVVP